MEKVFIQSDLLFDDVAILENKHGKEYLRLNAENISPDCNCSGYTEIKSDEERSAA